MDNEKYFLFLLGGNDLEMITIRTVLEKRKIRFIDRQLQWDNACLSNYKEELNFYGSIGSPWRIFGVELREDMVVPPNYTMIDHHDQYADYPSSLEQVMELLRLPLNRHQSLVAANDRAYIPGLQAMGATIVEISDIRCADRKAQGVSEEDEKLSELAIANNREDLGDLIVVHALSPRFSPICDRLFPYRRLLIYTDTEWMYYGEGMIQIKKLLEGTTLNNSLFHGGGNNGYLGIKQGSYSPDEICKMVEQIKRFAI